MHTAAISGETLLTHDGHHAWDLHTPDLPPQQLVLPTGRDDCVGIDRDTGDFVVALGTAGRPHWQLQLVRITIGGQVHPGPLLTPTDSRGQRPFLAGAPLRMFHGGVVATVNSDLTLGPTTRLPKGHVDGGALGENAWTMTYRSTADPLRPWWPLLEPADPASPLPMIPIFTILEPRR
ncbi:hypothetical protein [Williamsia sp. 1135]|uniref:hypothetical protein n=1 Tax=Williamsia sp. 1135 TaxID=1889262 RepID=UPI000A0F8438|nr:hypothetical protein [Williamsia sp. 1135]ORM27808.1 hypothetical protein BFL43_22205 [Williamsia sp. 1135]